MKTLLTDLSECGIPPFTFAGMRFPKHLWTLPRGSKAKRLAQRKPVVCGAYYHAPRPLTSGESHGLGFYLDSDGMPGLRWQWCDEVKGASIRHKGWFTSEGGWDGETARGIVFRLPHGRGFLAGYSLGEGMCGSLEYDIYPDEVDAAYAADSYAENVAEREREYQAEQEADCD